MPLRWSVTCPVLSGKPSSIHRSLFGRHVQPLPSLEAEVIALLTPAAWMAARAAVSSAAV